MKEVHQPSEIHWYTDKALSGLKFHNRKTEDILQLAMEGNIQELWVVEIDRIGRESRELLRFFLTLSDYDVLIRTPNKVYNFKDLGDLLAYVIEAKEAEDYVRKLTKRTNTTRVRNFQEKKWKKTSIPIGYEEDDEWIKKK